MHEKRLKVKKAEAKHIESKVSKLAELALDLIRKTLDLWTFVAAIKGHAVSEGVEICDWE